MGTSKPQILTSLRAFGLKIFKFGGDYKSSKKQKQFKTVREYHASNF